MKKKLCIAIMIQTSLYILAFGQAGIYEGKKLYQLKCGRCHFAYSPHQYSSEEWETIVKEMGSLAGLNEEGEEIILNYLQQEAGTKKADKYPGPALSGYLYTEYFASKDIVNTFDLHYLNVNMTGRLHDRVSYRGEFEFEHGGAKDEPPFVEQAYIDVWLLKNMALRIGAMLTPFNRFDEFHGPLENLLVTRPQMSREIGVSAWKEVGINIHGNVFVNKSLYINYDLYALNGLGSGSRLRNSRQYRDNNDAKSLGLRLSSVISDRFEFGVSYYQGAWDDEGDFNLNILGFHFLGKIGELTLFGEYAKSTSENPEPVNEGKANGFFCQASYLISKMFRPTIRYGTLDYLDKGTLLGRKPTDKETKVTALGLCYYLTQDIALKFEYDIIQEGSRNQDIDNNLLALQAAVRF